MNCRHMFNRLRFGAALASGIFSLSVALAPPARAATDSFTVKIAEKQQALSDPTDESLQHFLMWDMSADRVIARNMPYLELSNDADSTSPITAFHLTIGDTRFHFDCAALGSCAMLGKTTPDVSLSSAVSAITGDSASTSGDQLNLTIGNGGLQPGQVVRFKIALAVDPGLNIFAHPDYRTILFDMNGRNVYDGNLINDDSDDNATVSAAFTLSNGTTLLAGPTPFVDPTVTGVESQYYNNIYRHYGVMEPVDTFLVQGSVAGVPEPSSLAIAMIGVLFGAFNLSRRRQRFTA
jgi:PEP-CTERM motif